MTVDPQWQNFRCWACGKFGDVFTFVMERERVEFREALELLARRANISLRPSGGGPETKIRLQMYDLMKWAEDRYHRFLLEAPGAAEARDYLCQRHLSDETIRKYGLGYAPGSWSWLSEEAQRAGWSSELLVQVGLSARRESDGSCYDRFRERVMFPIRDVRGRTVGFGGRILPNSSSSATAPKYYNSSDTPLFSKSEHLYGLDQARAAGEAAGYLAVVEGYTDVLMAHQHGVMPVVATLGTALNVRHIAQLRRFVPKVVLVFDADAGGERGVDQALELFISQDVDLAIATLPAGLDPCDLLVRQGPEPLQAALEQAVDALDFKLSRVMTPEQTASLESKRRALDAVLEVLAAVPPAGEQKAVLKRELMATRLAQRAGVSVETVWNRLNELRRQRRPARPVTVAGSKQESPPQQAPADPAERQLLEVLLAEPELLARARSEVSPEELHHPGLQRVLNELYAVLASGQTVTVDQVRARLSDNPRLADHVLRLQAVGREIPQRSACLEDLLQFFQKRRVASQVEEIRGKLRSTPSDGPLPVELLRQLQQQATE
jgi:DNA primase